MIGDEFWSAKFSGREGICLFVAAHLTWHSYLALSPLACVNNDIETKAVLLGGQVVLTAVWTRPKGSESAPFTSINMKLSWVVYINRVYSILFPVKYNKAVTESTEVLWFASLALSSSPDRFHITQALACIPVLSYTVEPLFILQFKGFFWHSVSVVSIFSVTFPSFKIVLTLEFTFIASLRNLSWGFHCTVLTRSSLSS
jgi:hypothetical protein